MTDFSAIAFDSAAHAYTYAPTGQRLTSVTKFVGQFKRPFDAEYWAKKKAKERGVEPETVRAEWAAKSKASTELGTRVHAFAEAELLRMPNRPAPTTPEMTAWAAWHRFAGWRAGVIRAEWIIGDVALGLAGTSDAVLIHPRCCHEDGGAIGDGLAHVWDWKTGDKFNTESPYGKFLLPPFDDLPECELSSYSIQLSTYRLILQRNTNLRLGDSYIVHLQRDGGFRVVRALDLTDRILRDCFKGNG